MEGFKFVEYFLGSFPFLAMDGPMHRTTTKEICAEYRKLPAHIEPRLVSETSTSSGYTCAYASFLCLTGLHLNPQIFNEAERLAQGRRLKIHCLTKATASSNSFGPNTSQRFDMLIATPLRLVGMIKSGAIDLSQYVAMETVGQLYPLLVSLKLNRGIWWTDMYIGVIPLVDDCFGET